MSDRGETSRRNGRLGGRPAERGERAETTSLRITPTERQLIEQAAALDGISWTQWLVRAAARSAARRLRAAKED